MISDAVSVLRAYSAMSGNKVIKYPNTGKSEKWDCRLDNHKQAQLTPLEMAIKAEAEQA